MNEIEISSVTEYLNIVEQYKGNHYFRGQANSEWLVEPCVYRDTTKLMNESIYINEHYTNDTETLLKKILSIQHYGKGTRLCDVTINPTVALYFAIEDESQDNESAAIFVFDKSKNILMDSPEAKVLLLLTVENINDISQLKYECEHNGINISLKQLEEIIQKNYIIDYNIELSYSNNRALLQGGTGIYFGFNVQKGVIKRKGKSDIDSMITKIVIPKQLKSPIRKLLSKVGIIKSVLYDEDKSENKELSYNIADIKIVNRCTFNKVIINIKISDVIFVEKDILKIVLQVIHKIKIQYGKNSRIFMYVFYDDEDKRCYNWIAMPNYNEIDGFNLKYNNEYLKKRMSNINREISVNTIISLTEPIIEKCEKAYSEIVKSYDGFFIEKIDMQKLKEVLQQIRNSIFQMIYFDLQDIEHGIQECDGYYNESNNFCIAVDTLAENMILSIDRKDEAYSFSNTYNTFKTDVENYYIKYKKAMEKIK